MNTANSEKPIYARIWSPLNALFKAHRNDPAYCEVFYCDAFDRCPLLKNKQCINNMAFGPRCPHGYVIHEKGPTKRTKFFHSWLEGKRKEYEHLLTTLSGGPSQRLAQVGDWIYLPYPHMDMNEKIPFQRHSAFFISGSPFIKKELFTLEIIKSIVDFHPYALMGGEITEYQKKYVPSFLWHLEESFPELYSKIVEYNPHYVEQYSLTTKNYVGRIALIRTLAPGELVIGKHTFEWNGTELVSKVFDTLWVDVDDINGKKAIDSISVRIVPSERAAIKITNNSQVQKSTVFLD